MALSTIGTNAITDATIATGDIADDAVTAAKAGFSPGKIGQIVTTTFTGTESTLTEATNNAYTDSSVAATITPTAASSKIMVMCTINAGSTDSSNGVHIGRFTQAIRLYHSSFYW